MFPSRWESLVLACDKSPNRKLLCSGALLGAWADCWWPSRQHSSGIPFERQVLSARTQSSASRGTTARPRYPSYRAQCSTRRSRPRRSGKGSLSTPTPRRPPSQTSGASAIPCGPSSGSLMGNLPSRAPCARCTPRVLSPLSSSSRSSLSAIRAQRRRYGPCCFSLSSIRQISFWHHKRVVPQPAPCRHSLPAVVAGLCLRAASEWLAAMVAGTTCVRTTYASSVHILLIAADATAKSWLAIAASGCRPWCRPLQ